MSDEQKPVIPESGGVRSQPGPFGILDTKDNLWIENDNGPVRFDAWDIAQAAAQLAEARAYGTDLGMRFKAQPLPSTKHMRVRDELKFKLSVEKAFQRTAGE